MMNNTYAIEYQGISHYDYFPDFLKEFLEPGDRVLVKNYPQSIHDDNKFDFELQGWYYPGTIDIDRKSLQKITEVLSLFNNGNMGSLEDLIVHHFDIAREDIPIGANDAETLQNAETLFLTRKFERKFFLNYLNLKDLVLEPSSKRTFIIIEDRINPNFQIPYKYAEEFKQFLKDRKIEILKPDRSIFLKKFTPTARKRPAASDDPTAKRLRRD